ncbi:MAG: hypothetical protein LBU47_07540, partial [Christensenellaceae bacterium]|nr:hypothetical protein [Christensenellaceae bacterium]
ALMLVPPEERDRIAVLVDVGYLNTEILFVRGDALVYHEVFGLGGGHITADLAYGLKFTMEMAEELKRKFAFGAGQDLSATDSSGREVHVSREKAAEIILPRAEEIAEEAQKIIDSAGIRLDSRSAFYLTGGGLMMRGNREYVSNIFERSVKTPQPMAVKLNSPMYSAALGLLELVYESVSQLDLKPDASGKKGGKFGQMVKGFFTK